MAGRQVDHNYLIRNQTPDRVVLRGRGQMLILAPLQSRSVGADPVDFLGDAALVAHERGVIDWEPEPLRSKRLLWATWLAVVGIAGAALGGIIYAARGSVAGLVCGVGIGVLCASAAAYSVGQGRHARYAQPKRRARRVGRMTVSWAAALAGVGLAAGGLAAAGALQDWTQTAITSAIGVAVLCGVGLAFVLGTARAREELTPAARPPLAVVPVRGDAWDLVRDFLIATVQGLVILVVIVVAVAAPALAIYYGTELSTVIVFKPWNHPHLVQGKNSEYIVVGRLLQLVLLILVSLVPALMFFQFDREKLTTLVDRWLHAIFRLDPSLRTVADVDAKYGRRVEEYYGATLSLGTLAPRKRLRDRSPVVVCTVLIAIGWILVLLNQATRQQDTLPSFQTLFRPTPTPMTLAFLGAYFLSVQVALRGYLRGDLKPKTYNVIMVRILMAIVLAWVMQALWGTTQLTLGLAFLAGIVPNTVLRWIREAIEGTKNAGQARIKAGQKATATVQPTDTIGVRDADEDELREKSPLSLLDDVDIYDRTRLEEEGITGVQALARHDLVDLILSSRIPVPRLVDWLDQAILHQHARGAIAILRAIGIRTATDYLRVLTDDVARSQLVEVLKDKPGAPRIDVLRCVLEADEWVPYLQNWRAHNGTEGVREVVFDVAHLPRRVPGAGPAGPSNGHRGPARSVPNSRTVFEPSAFALRRHPVPSVVISKPPPQAPDGERPSV